MPDKSTAPDDAVTTFEFEGPLALLKDVLCGLDDPFFSLLHQGKTQVSITAKISPAFRADETT